MRNIPWSTQSYKHTYDVEIYYSNTRASHTNKQAHTFAMHCVRKLPTKMHQTGWLAGWLDVRTNRDRERERERQRVQHVGQPFNSDPSEVHVLMDRTSFLCSNERRTRRRTNAACCNILYYIFGGVGVGWNWNRNREMRTHNRMLMLSRVLRISYVCYMCNVICAMLHATN